MGDVINMQMVRVRLLVKNGLMEYSGGDPNKLSSYDFTPLGFQYIKTQDYYVPFDQLVKSLERGDTQDLATPDEGRE